MARISAKGKTAQPKIEVGQTITLSKVIKLVKVYGNGTVQGNDGRTYDLSRFTVSTAKSLDLPVMPGDTWEAGGNTFVVTADHNGNPFIAPVFMTGGMMHDPNDMEWFEAQNPVLVSRLSLW